MHPNPRLTGCTGSGESGKSTIVKQMKIIHQNGYTKAELMTYRTTIYRNLLESAHNIILAMRKIGVDCVQPENRARTERILDYEVLADAAFVFDEDMAQAVLFAAANQYLNGQTFAVDGGYTLAAGQ